ncbi:MAG: hypothetical protein HC808_06745 [Candidatus Competibacteraceae bacterium]|nr:hypothetical protein [Candidatus Competibacteraceae bacterium]
MNTTVLDREINYSDSGGQPMADNTKQFRWIVTIENGLEVLFADRSDVFVENLDNRDKWYAQAQIHRT